MSQVQSESDELQEGYQEVQIGPERLEIPEEWTVTTVNDVASRFISGGTPDSGNENYWGGDIPWTTAAVVEGPQFDGEKDFITEEGLENSSTSLVPEGSILFGTRVNVANVGRTAKEIAISQDLTGIILDESKVDSGFFTWYLLFNQNKIKDRYSQGSTIQGMLTGDLKSLPLISPPLPEQRRIADILSTVDEQIQQTDEMIHSLIDLKDGLSQDVFDVQTTKEDPDGETEKEILGEFIEVISGTHVKSDLVSADESKTPYITGPDDFKNRGFQVTKYTDDPPSFCEEGDTLVTVKGSGCGASAFANQRAGISRQLKALRANENLDPCYLYYWVQTKESFLSILAQGTSIPGLSTTDLTTLQIPLPPLEQQEYIGEMLSTIDSRLDEEREQKQHLQELKRGLMQDLLTGKIRVNTD